MLFHRSLGVMTYQLLSRRHPFEDPKIRPKNFDSESWKRDHFFNSSHVQHMSVEARYETIHDKNTRR